MPRSFGGAIAALFLIAGCLSSAPVLDPSVATVPVVDASAAAMVTLFETTHDFLVIEVRTPFHLDTDHADGSLAVTWARAVEVPGDAKVELEDAGREALAVCEVASGPVEPCEVAVGEIAAGDYVLEFEGRVVGLRARVTLTGVPATSAEEPS